MNALAAGALVAACVYVGISHPLIALTALIVFAVAGAIYDLSKDPEK